MLTYSYNTQNKHFQTTNPSNLSKTLHFTVRHEHMEKRGVQKNQFIMIKRTMKLIT